MTQTYPLSWPDGLPRTERKASSQFRSTLSAALKNVQKSLVMFGQDSGKVVTDIVLSSNVAGISFDLPKDTGVAAWFTWDGAQRCIAVDRYPKPEDNLQAIHHILEARRTEMRHGGLHIVRQTFKGFVALPAPPDAKSWREVLGLSGDVTDAEINTAYRDKANKAHPDKGGTTEAMAVLNRARAEAKAAVL
jgi:DnaJ domain